MIPYGADRPTHLEKQTADAEAFAAEVARIRAGRPAPAIVETAEPASTDGDTCGCWMHDCDECGRRLADGERPAKGARRRAAIQHEAAMQRAREKAHRDGEQECLAGPACPRVQHADACRPVCGFARTAGHA